MSNGAKFGGVEATPEREMEAFDSLPPEARALLNYGHINYSAVQLAAAGVGSSRSMGGFTITRPGEREQIIAKIAATESAIPPLKEPKRPEREPKVARATLRPVAPGRMFSSRSR